MSGVLCDHGVSRNENGDVSRREATLRQRQEAELQVVEIKMLGLLFSCEKDGPDQE